MNKDIIEIKFGVKGGANIHGESGSLIKKQIDGIAENLKPYVKIHVNRDHFSKQLKELQDELKQKLGEIKIDIKTSTAEVGATAKPADNDAASAASNAEVYEKARKALDAYYKAQSQLNKIEPVGEKSTVNVERLRASVGTLRDKYNELRGQLGQTSEDYKKLVKMEGKYADALANEKEVTTGIQTSYAKIGNRLQSLYDNYEDIIKRSPDAKEALDNFAKLYNGGNGLNGKNYQEAKDYISQLGLEFQKTEETIKKCGLQTDTLGNKIKTAFDKKIFDKLIYLGVMMVGQAFQQVYQNVLDLDKAVTDLQIATGKTREETRTLVKSYSDLSQQLGATMTEVTAAADTWLRQGYTASETAALISDSMMLSKLGQIDSAEASKALTSAMKGYKVEVEDATRIVDRLTAVDMEAAVSAGDIATAMAETAVSAETSGISMDKLIGYIATVSEVTQDGAESVGTFYKTMFARMGNVKAGRFVDDETGEDLNDVEKVLGELNISLRDSEGMFRNFDEVLDEVGESWDTYNNTEQRAIATAMAGTRQQEKFMVLMENYGQAMDYAATSTNSIGTAQSKYSEAYMGSIESSIDKLTASWQEFSSNILDSDLVKGGIDFLNTIVQVLNSLTSAGDGTAVKMVLLVGACWLLSTALKNLGTKIVSTTSSMGGLGAGIKKLMSSEMLWLGALVTAMTVAMEILEAYLNKEKEVAEASKERAEASRQDLEEAKKQTTSIRDLANEYSNLEDEIGDGSNVNAETRQKILDIQKKINATIDDENKKVDLVNSSYEESIAKLKEIQGLKAAEEYTKAVGAYADSNTAYNNAYETSYTDTGGWSLLDPETVFQAIFERGNDESKYAKEVYDYLAQSDNFGVRKDSTIGDKFYGVNLSKNIKAPEKAVEAIDEVLTWMNEQGYSVESADIYSVFLNWKNKYQTLIDNKNSSVISMLESMISNAGFNTDDNIQNTDDYNQFRSNIIEKVKSDKNISSAIGSGALDDSDIHVYVDNWLSTFYSEWYNASHKAADIYRVESKSLLDILGATEEQVNSLTAAEKEWAETGRLSVGAVSDIMEKFPVWGEYLEETADGYILADGALNKYLDSLEAASHTELEMAYASYKSNNSQESFDELTKAYDNYLNQKRINEMYTRDDLEEKYINTLKKQKEALESELDAYSQLSDFRKELLSSYAEEVKYQKELEKRQKNIAKLQAKLSVSRLDQSLEGRAKTQEIEAELAEANEDLEEFTLDHAIEELTAQIENDYARQETLIKDQVKSIEETITSVGSLTSEAITSKLTELGEEDALENNTEVDPNFSQYTLEDIIGAIKAGFQEQPLLPLPDRGTGKSMGRGTGIYAPTVTTRHSGGFIGEPALKSNEAFSKLLLGEFVSTPAQMDNFMKDVIPSIANYSSRDGANFNSPLVSITCGSVSQDTMPDLQKAIDKAVAGIKEEIDNVFSRTGYRKPVSKFKL